MSILTGGDKLDRRTYCIQKPTVTGNVEPRHYFLVFHRFCPRTERACLHKLRISASTLHDDLDETDRIIKRQGNTYYLRGRTSGSHISLSHSAVCPRARCERQTSLAFSLSHLAVSSSSAGNPSCPALLSNPPSVSCGDSRTRLFSSLLIPKSAQYGSYILAKRSRPLIL